MPLSIPTGRTSSNIDDIKYSADNHQIERRACCRPTPVLPAGNFGKAASEAYDGWNSLAARRAKDASAPRHDDAFPLQAG